MSDTISKGSFLLALFVSFYYLQIVHVSAINLPAYDVIVASRLPQNSSYLLRIHCQSKDNDIGFHDLRPNERIRWHFRMNYWHTTKFWCHFWWGNKDTSFDVMSWSFARHHCGRNPLGNTCFWAAQEDGFYFGTAEDPLPEYLQKLREWPQ